MSGNQLAVVGALLALALLWTGCAVRTQDDVSIARPGGLDRALFGDYWEVSGGFESPAPGRVKVAISEFTVEFVRERVLHFADQRGLTSRTMIYQKESVDTLPSLLHEEFRKRLEARGRDLMSVVAVTGSKAYRDYIVHKAPGPVKMDLHPGIESEVGKARETRLYAADGLLVVVGSPEDNARTDAALAEELGVDVVLRLRFVVGVQKGRASIEPGSTVHITRGGKHASMVSQRSLRSSSTVTKSLGTGPNTQGQYIVEPHIFMGAHPVIRLNDETYEVIHIAYGKLSRSVSPTT